MNKKVNLYLYIQSVDIDGPVTYTVFPESNIHHKDEFIVHSWEYDPATEFCLRVNFSNREHGTQSHLKICKLVAGDIDITPTLQYNSYVRSDTNEVVKGTYGYMSWPGVYTIKVKYAPMVHQYMFNFLQRCFAKKL
jgi:hypothetical protein